MPDKMYWTEPPVPHYVRSTDVEVPGSTKSETVMRLREAVTVSLPENWWFESGLNGSKKSRQRQRAQEYVPARIRQTGHEMRRHA